MAAALFGVSEYGSFSDKRIVYGGGSSFAHRGATHGSSKVLICICSNSNDQNMDGWAKRTMKIKFDFINKELKSRLRIPLFGLFAEEKRAKEGKSSESVDSSVLQNTRKSRGNESKSDEEEEDISARRQSKPVAVSFTPEKAKSLRKTLRSTSNFHDLMYHSAIASRLASAESSTKEGNSS